MCECVCAAPCTWDRLQSPRPRIEGLDGSKMKWLLVHGSARLKLFSGAFLLAPFLTVLFFEFLSSIRLRPKMWCDRYAWTVSPGERASLRVWWTARLEPCLCPAPRPRRWILREFFYSFYSKKHLLVFLCSEQRSFIFGSFFPPPQVLTAFHLLSHHAVFHNLTAPEQIQSLFPAAFHPNLKNLITKILLEQR